MLKTTIFFTLIFASVLCVRSASPCRSCGPECESACGTRHFRTCCFNYLRRKRGPDAAKISGANLQGVFRLKSPVLSFGDPEPWSDWSNDVNPGTLDDIMENTLKTFDE